MNSNAYFKVHKAYGMKPKTHFNYHNLPLGHNLFLFSLIGIFPKIWKLYLPKAHGWTHPNFHVYFSFLSKFKWFSLLSFIDTKYNIIFYCDVNIKI